jgi:hypothetical protein
MVINVKNRYVTVIMNFHEIVTRLIIIIHQNYALLSPGTLKSPTWHKMEKEGLQDAVEESEQRRMLLVNRLKDAQDTLKVRGNHVLNTELFFCKTSNSFVPVMNCFPYCLLAQLYICL